MMQICHAQPFPPRHRSRPRQAAVSVGFFGGGSCAAFGRACRRVRMSVRLAWWRWCAESAWAGACQALRSQAAAAVRSAIFRCRTVMRVSAPLWRVLAELAVKVLPQKRSCPKEERTKKVEKRIAGLFGLRRLGYKKSRAVSGLIRWSPGHDGNCFCEDSRGADALSWPCGLRGQSGRVLFRRQSRRTAHGRIGNSCRARARHRNNKLALGFVCPP